jgi:hypothetical protein
MAQASANAADFTADPKGSVTPIRKPRLVKKPAKRAKSSGAMPFPYVDLENVTAVARSIINNGSQLSRDQLAGALGQSPGSGAFILKVSAARQFGLVDLRDGKFQLTDLGFSIVDKNEAREKQARVQAFFNVPLYRRVYEDFKGKQLPDRPHGLDNTLINIGVAPKLKSNARLAFEKSARYAGFFNVDPDRLIEPVIAGGVSGASTDGPVGGGPTGGGGGISTARLGALDPLIQGLLARLPPTGEAWSAEKRKKWLQTFEANLEMIYPAKTEPRGPDFGSNK